MGRVTADRLAGYVDIDKDRRRLQLVFREKEGLIEVAGGLGGRRVIVFFLYTQTFEMRDVGEPKRGGLPFAIS
jgi:hypothetical protein